jgi:hypothetical protein
VTRLLFIALYIEVGVVLIIIPWSAFWDRNHFATLVPLLQGVITNNFVRGAVSGLGVINLVVGIAELMSLFMSRPSSRHVSIGSHLTND